MKLMDFEVIWVNGVFSNLVVVVVVVLRDLVSSVPLILVTLAPLAPTTDTTILLISGHLGLGGWVFCFLCSRPLEQLPLSFGSFLDKRPCLLTLTGGLTPCTPAKSFNRPTGSFAAGRSPPPPPGGSFRV